MKRDVYLNNSAIITGLGSLDQTWNALLANRSGIVEKEHFANSLLPRTGLSLYQRELSEPPENVTQSLMEECLADLRRLPKDTFLIWTGIKNNVEAIESLHHEAKTPCLASAHAFRSWLTDLLGVNNGGMEINAACASSTVGVAMAAQYIAEGTYDHVFVAGADIVSRFVYYGFASLKAMTEERCMPFDRRRNGLSLGDGAVGLFLSAERDSDIRIAGYGVTNDANHITGPSKDGSGLAMALRQAVAMSKKEPGDIQAFCGHGTATLYNDSMELLATHSVFGDESPPIFGVKGAIGHTLGAAGGIEIALCGKCLEEGVLPPTVGCGSPESPLVTLERTKFSGENIITSNSGFGGVNAAILMERLA